MRSGQSRAQAIREEKRAETILKLKNLGLLQHVVETATKLADLDQELDSVQVQRLRAANDSRLALIKKYLPDLKQTELVGEDGDPIKVDNTFKVEFVSASSEAKQ